MAPDTYNERESEKRRVEQGIPLWNKASNSIQSNAIESGTTRQDNTAASKGSKGSPNKSMVGRNVSSSNWWIHSNNSYCIGTNSLVALRLVTYEGTASSRVGTKQEEDAAAVM
jgi:hypothetical protein